MAIAFDTLVAAHILDEQRPLNLLDQAVTELGVSDWGKGTQSFGIEPGDPETILARNQPTKTGQKSKKYLGTLYGEEGLGAYCAKDTAYTHALYEVQRQKLSGMQPQARLLKHLILPGLEAFAQVELNGIYVHWDRVYQRAQETKELIEYLHKELLTSHVSDELQERFSAIETDDEDEATGKDMFQNPGFLRAWLFSPSYEGGLGLMPMRFTPKMHEAAVDEETLKVLDHPAAKMLLEYRKAIKLLSFYEQWHGWRGTDGRLHPYFNLTGTVTGRRSCDNPNLQQVPRDPKARSCLGAPPGWKFVQVDYSQLEVRLAAWFANEDTMLDIFANGGDIYAYTGLQLSGHRNVPITVTKNDIDKEMRQKAKAVVLGFLYGMGAKKFMLYAKEMYQVDFTLEEAIEYRDKFFALFPKLIQYHNRQRFMVKRDHQVVSPAGRIRHLTDILSTEEYVRGDAERQAINAPIQGFGGDITLASIVTLTEEIPLDEGMIVGDIHDAVLFQLRDDVWHKWSKRILEVMECPPLLQKMGVVFPIRLIAEGSVGDAWGSGATFTLDGTGGTTPIDDMAA